jgi:hypothetical protein
MGISVSRQDATRVPDMNQGDHGPKGDVRGSTEGKFRIRLTVVDSAIHYRLQAGDTGKVRVPLLPTVGGERLPASRFENREVML